MTDRLREKTVESHYGEIKIVVQNLTRNVRKDFDEFKDRVMYDCPNLTLLKLLFDIKNFDTELTYVNKAAD